MRSLRSFRLPAWRRVMLVPLLGLLLPLGGCEWLGIESPKVIAERKEAEGKAIGAGCRHAARSVEQCYGNNKRADKSAIFAGWKEMNDYMRENNIEAVPAPPEPAVASASGDAEAPANGTKPGHGPEAGAGKPSEKAADKAAGKAGEKAEGKGAARPAEKAAEKGTDKAVDKAADKGADRGADKSGARTGADKPLKVAAKPG